MTVLLLLCVCEAHSFVSVLSALTVEDEKRALALLINGFVRMVSLRAFNARALFISVSLRSGVLSVRSGVFRPGLRAAAEFLRGGQSHVLQLGAGRRSAHSRESLEAGIAREHVVTFCRKICCFSSDGEPFVHGDETSDGREPLAQNGRVRPGPSVSLS